MESIERAFGIGPGGPNRETQPRRVNPDSPELIAREWQELNLATIREILTAEQNEWVKIVLGERLKKQGIDFESSPPEEKEEEIKKLIEELQQIKTREELLSKLKELKELGLDTTKIINLFGLVYIPDNYTVIAVTDIHGDFDALEAAIGEFEEYRKKPGAKVAFVCMGDFVDRGRYNFEVVKRLFELKRKYQDEVIILKGDHEDDAYIQEKDGIYVHIDSADFLELLGEAQQIQIPIPGSDRVLIRTKLTVEERVRELYIDTFSKLPHAVIYRDVLITHAGLPVDVEIKGDQINLEKGGILGRLIAPSKEDLRQIYWSDIDLSRDVNRGRIRESVDLSPKRYSEIVRNLGFQYFIRGHQSSYAQTSLFKNYPLAYRLFEESIITFHSNQSYYGGRDYKEGCYLVLNPDGSIVAKGVEGGQEINIVQPKEEVSTLEPSKEQPQQAEFTSQETMGGKTSLGASPDNPKNKPDGEASLQSSSGEAPKPPSGEQPFSGESPFEDPSLEDLLSIENESEALKRLLEKLFENLKREYKEYLSLIPNVDKNLDLDILQPIKAEFEAQLIPVYQDIKTNRFTELKGRIPIPSIPNEEIEKHAKEFAFNYIKQVLYPSLRENFRRYIGIFLLSHIEPLSNEAETVRKFLKDKCSIEDLEYFLKKKEERIFIIKGEGKEDKKIEFKIKALDLEIKESWKQVIGLILAEHLKNKEVIIKYIKKILDKTKSDLETLREQLKKDKAFRELVKASLIRKKGRKFILGSEIDKEIDKMVDELATKEILDIAELNKLPGEDLRKFLVLLQEFGKELKLGEEAKEEGKKEEKKEEKPSEFLTALRDSLYTALLMGITSIPLWIAFLGFFAPLWLIERVKKDVKI